MSEEIVQETFEVAIKNIDKFKGECKISSWLCQIAKYIWYKTLKKNKKIKNVSFEEIENEVISDTILEEKILEKQEKIEIYKKIQKLDEETRNVMYLRILGNLDYNQIAEIMNKTRYLGKNSIFPRKTEIERGNER